VPLIEGDLIMTNYKLIFKTSIFPLRVPTFNRGLPPFLDHYLTVPLSYIQKIDKLGAIEIFTKDQRYMKFDFESRNDECTKAYNRIKAYAFPENEMQDIFAFKFTLPLPESVIEKQLYEDGWNVWDPIKEFEVDQQINFKNPNCNFRIFENKDYTVSATYPLISVIPNSIND
jgi:hypothetical protein